jgi:hypothetical protein
VRIETKYGTQTFRIRRSGQHGDYRASFLDRSSGTLTNYSYRIQVTSLEGRRLQVEITMTAFSEDVNGVSVNIELRKSPANDANVFGAKSDQGVIKLPESKSHGLRSTLTNSVGGPMSIRLRMAQPDAHFQEHRVQAETANPSRHFQEVIRYSGSPSNDQLRDLGTLMPLHRRRQPCLVQRAYVQHLFARVQQ